MVGRLVGGGCNGGVELSSELCELIQCLCLCCLDGMNLEALNQIEKQQVVI